MDVVWRDAAVQGDLQKIVEMAAAGADIDQRDKYGQTAVMLAAWRGRTDVVRWLIDAGAKLDVTAKYGLSATMLAVLNGHDEAARLLARAGADLSKKGSGAPGFAGRTAADLARGRGMTALADELDAGN
jgi:ankyrin repeat protein